MHRVPWWAFVGLIVDIWLIFRYISILRHPDSLRRRSLLYWWWANDWSEGQPRTESLDFPIQGVLGDVVFYRHEHAPGLGEGKFNHAAVVVGWGPQTRKERPTTLQFLQTSYVVDHDGPPWGGRPHSINDTNSEVNRIVIVHIPDDIPEPDQPWVECK